LGQAQVDAGVAQPTGHSAISYRRCFSDYSPDACVVYLPRSLYRRYWRDDAIDGVALLFQTWR
jgi:hypothetical protein